LWFADNHDDHDTDGVDPVTWKSPGMTHLWCPKCQKQYGTDAEVVLKDGKIVFKSRCNACGSENFSEG
jgi:uncharacterized radical SAM superfamily Fe-S cluster-containing enzyme